MGPERTIQRAVSTASSPTSRKPSGPGQYVVFELREGAIPLSAFARASGELATQVIGSNEERHRRNTLARIWRNRKAHPDPGGRLAVATALRARGFEETHDEFKNTFRSCASAGRRALQGTARRSS